MTESAVPNDQVRPTLAANLLGSFAAMKAALRGGGRFGATAHVIALRSLALAVNLCTGLLTAAVLGPAGRGEQAALIVAPQFLSSISTLGLHASLIYNIKKDPANEGRYIGTGLLLTFFAGIVATGLGWFLVPHWLSRYDDHVVAISRMLLLLTPLWVMAPMLMGALEARGEFGFANRTIYMQSLATLVVLAGLWFANALTPLSAAITYMAPTILANLYIAYHVNRLYRVVFKPQRHIAKIMLHYGMRFYGVDLLGTLAGYLDQIVLVSLLAPEIIGVYVVALSLSRVLTVLQGAVTTVLFPDIAARPEAGVIATVAATVRVTSVVGVAAALTLGIIGPPLISLVYGAKFSGAAGPFRLLVAETVVSNAARILYQAFSGTGRPGAVTAFEAIGVSISLTSMLLIVPRYGATGAAFCVLMASCVRLVCVVVALPLMLKVSMPRLIISKADLHWSQL